MCIYLGNSDIVQTWPEISTVGTGIRSRIKTQLNIIGGRHKLIGSIPNIKITRCGKTIHRRPRELDNNCRLYNLQLVIDTEVQPVWCASNNNDVLAEDVGIVMRGFDHVGRERTPLHLGFDGPTYQVVPA